MVARRTVLVVLMVAALTGGCGAKEITEDDARSRAQGLTSDGTVSSASKQTGSEGKAEWKVMMAMTGGGMVEAVYEADSGELAELFSETAPFEYEIGPGGSFIKYSTAKQKALSTKSGAVEAWEFARSKDQFEFYVRDANQQLWEIKMKASDGTITSTVQKAARD